MRSSLVAFSAVALACCSRTASPPRPPALAAGGDYPPAVAAAPPPLTSPAPPRPTSFEVRFAHSAPGAWSADYTFSRPVRTVAFTHPTIPRDAWRIVEPTGARLSGAFLVSPRPFTTVRIELPTRTDDVEREYTPFRRYTDRGVLVYLGQLALAAAECGSDACTGDGAPRAGDPLPGTITAVAISGERVVVPGRSASAEASVASTDRGTFAYFGSLVPVEADGFLGLIDQGLPEWIRARVQDDVPRLFTLYSDRLGPLPGARPTLFLTFAPRESGSSMGGSVLPPRVLALDLGLSPPLLRADDPRMVLDLGTFIAHEGAHFWNGDLHPPPDDEGASWMHEGTADALATRALHAVGMLDDAAYRERLSLAAAECALWLSGGRELTASGRPGHSDAFYVCGSTISLLVEAACQMRDPKADLFTFWKAVFAETTDARPGYDEALFHRVLDRLSGDREIGDLVTRIVHEPLADPTKTLRDALAHVGLVTRVPPGPLPDDYERRASIPEMDAILPRACAESLVFDGNRAVEPEVSADGACPGLRKGDVIESLAGVRVGPRGGTSFRAAHASCLGRGTVVATTARKTRVTLPCASPLGPIPSYFTLERVP